MENQKVLVHMAYYSEEADVIGETEKSYKVLMPKRTILGLQMPEFEIWIPKEHAEIIKSPHPLTT